MSYSEAAIEKAVKNAAAITEVEGFTVTEEHKMLIKKILLGEITTQEAINEIRKKYK